MLIDLHMHTAEVSTCCRIAAQDNIILAKQKGFDGGAIMNHYTASYFTEDTFDEWIESYIAEWEHCRALGEKHGFRIFCGVEVTVDYDPRVHILIYGADERFLRENPFLNRMNLSELYALCRKHGYAMIQAHPYRNGTTVQDTDCLDGVEINCHPLYHNSFYREVTAVAKEHNFPITVGDDYHADTPRVTGGSILPDNIVTERELAEYILTSPEFTLQIHDPVTDKVFVMKYNRFEKP